jgi:hypothetical protein
MHLFQTSALQKRQACRGDKNPAPLRGLKPRWITGERPMLRIHLNIFGKFDWINEQSCRSIENWSNDNQSPKRGMSGEDGSVDRKSAMEALTPEPKNRVRARFLVPSQRAAPLH